MALRLLEWFLFAGVVGSVPLVADGIVLYWQRAFDWSSFLAKGDALLVGAVLCGAATGKLVLVGSRHKAPQLLAVCACVVTMAISSWQYAALHYTLGTTPDNSLAALASSFVLALYLVAVFSSALAAAIAG